jgi:hypothetical protein
MLEMMMHHGIGRLLIWQQDAGACEVKPGNSSDPGLFMVLASLTTHGGDC